MSLYALSKASGISYSTLDAAKRRGGQLTIDTIEIICETLNMPVYEFFMTDADWNDITKYVLERKSS